MGSGRLKGRGRLCGRGCVFFFQAEDGIRDVAVTGVQTCALPIFADATTGKVVRKLTSTASDPHFSSIQFIYSAGAWDSASKRIAIATVTGGRQIGRASCRERV